MMAGPFWYIFILIFFYYFVERTYEMKILKKLLRKLIGKRNDKCNFIGFIVRKTRQCTYYIMFLYLKTILFY